MQAEIVSITTYPDLAWSAQIKPYRNIIWRTVREAHSRAREMGRPILAAVSLPVERLDPLALYASFTNETTSFYWERPNIGVSLAGIGAAAIIDASGASCVSQVSRAWHEIIQSAVISATKDCDGNDESGPVGFGGFAFDPLARRASLWDGFPDGMLILPRLSLRCESDGVILALNRLIAPDDDIGYRTGEMLRDLTRLPDALRSSQDIAGNNSDEPLITHDILPQREWMDIVAGAIAGIRRGDYKKVVLARGVQASREAGTFDISTALRRLRSTYPTAHVFALRRGDRVFTGATPERLVSVEDRLLRTMGLAGTMPRGQTDEQDRQLGAELLHSAKNREEHHIVVETIRDALEGLCSRLDIPSAPRLLKLRNVQHLETPIYGQLLPELSILDAVACLHPTPAVGGFPREAALAKIRRDERLDRGWYAGPVGWIDAAGNGEFAVALRSALVRGSEAALFAGCGIVADSDPESEYAESCLKTQVMLRALAGDEEQPQ